MRNNVNLNINIFVNIHAAEYLYTYMPKSFLKRKCKLF